MPSKIKPELDNRLRQLLESNNYNAIKLLDEFDTLPRGGWPFFELEEELLKVWRRLTENEENNFIHTANTIILLATQHRFRLDRNGQFVSHHEQSKFEEFKDSVWKKQYSKEFIDLLCDSCFNTDDRKPSKGVILDYCENASKIGYCSGKVVIPNGLPQEEEEVYITLLGVVSQREAGGQKPPHIVVISDIAKDVDDLIAWVVLKELHRLGLVVLRGFIANFYPEKQRARHGRGVLDHLYLPAIPVAKGTCGGGKRPIPYPYEFEGEEGAKNFMAPQDTHFLDGTELLFNICNEARREKQKLTFLCISSLRDIREFTDANPSILPEVAEKVVIQGGYSITNSGDVVPTIKTEGKLAGQMDAANNKMDPDSATTIHRYISQNKFPTVCYTKYAAILTEIPIQLCIDLEATGHVLGKYLRKAQIAMDLEFYYRSLYPKEGEDVFFTQSSYLQYKTSWWKENYHLVPRPDFPDVDKEKGEIIKYLTKLTAYDALAALGASGDDVLSSLDILEFDKASPLHRVIGFAGNKDAGIPPNPVINPAAMAKAIMALTRGSILAAQQHGGRSHGLDGGYMGYRRKNRI
ncbi:hypothetical protein BGZ60DRAFT_396862 [Tricladium varicosporioides]|nr:hypothetical protein BGZ60DRAFT_396862 [Hymenoscyphus varicosporioides]